MRLTRAVTHIRLCDANDAKVAALDALSDVGARHGQHEPVAVDPIGPGVLERREPDGFGDLGSEELGRCYPQMISVAHQRLHCPSSHRIHSDIHTLWITCVATTFAYPRHGR